MKLLVVSLVLATLCSCEASSECAPYEMDCEDPVNMLDISIAIYKCNATLVFNRCDCPPNNIYFIPCLNDYLQRTAFDPYTCVTLEQIDQYLSQCEEVIDEKCTEGDQ